VSARGAPAGRGVAARTLPAVGQRLDLAEFFPGPAQTAACDDAGEHAGEQDDEDWGDAILEMEREEALEAMAAAAAVAE
jgi:hypothetical protein